MGVDLPEELVVDILYKLPVKAICKLKCVSKGWLNLLSDPEFKKNHSDRSKKKPNLLVLRREGNKLNVSWSSGRGNDQDAFTLLVDKDKYVGSPLKKPSGCGLICLWDYNVKFHVLNPSTHELKILPTPYPDDDYPVNNAGFGYIADSDEYVLINIRDYRDHLECRILKFSDGNAESCRWESVDYNCPFSPWGNHGRGHGVLIGNKFFWIANRYSPHNLYKMLDFDLESNEFSTIPLPDRFYHPSQRYIRWEWEELKEELCLVDTRSLNDLSTLELWILKDYTNHIWAKEYSIHYPVSGYDLTPFYFWDQKVLFNVWEKGTCYANQSIQCYDAKTTTFKTITNLTRRGTFAVEFTQSFFSLGTRSKKADGADERTTLKKNLVNASKGAATETNDK